MSLGLHFKHILNHFGYDIRYHRPLYELIIQPLGIKTVLDIGANDGAYAHQMTSLFPNATIIAFEPLGDCFSRLVEVAKAHPNILPQQYALGEVNETKEILKSSFHPSSSLLPMTALHKKLYPKSAGSEKESITVKRLDDVRTDLPISTPLLVKIDVQGFEDKVIKGGRETLRGASAIVVETSFFELYEGQPLFGDIHTLLRELGFSYYGALHTHHSKKTGQPVYEDSLFISSETVELFSSKELVS